MKRWQWATLLFEIALFALILVLPQVDLPDFTFHGVTAPVAAKARVSARPFQAITAALRTPFSRQVQEKQGNTISTAATHEAEPRLSVLCTLLC
jgi:hypothetical protein